ncbi:hypothetical protein [Vibrio cyclitrophicus]|uniref:hypothetical protein n=1 Tax=Vibrio cyclitrophicus TaxID=47951 RepID=UPI001113124A|nr:hypothetical protein [Vibrio cyclitrophicus]
MFGFINSSQHSQFRVSVLKGTKLVDLRCFSKGFALILNEHINEDVFCKLTAEYFNDAIIVSNALEFVIKDFLELKSLEYPVIGSSLVDDGLKLLGEYDLYVPSKGKVNVLLERYPSVVIDEFYTDDFEADYDLVDFSTVSRFVSKGKIAL